jgi:hypothetical protein
MPEISSIGKSLTPANAYVVPSNAQPEVIAQATLLKEQYGDLVQILTGTADEVAILTALAAIKTSLGGVDYNCMNASIKIMPGTVMLSATGLILPVMQNFVFDAEGVTINCPSTGDAIVFNSVMSSVIRLGILVSNCDATHTALRFKPVNNVPYDPTPGFVDNYVFIDGIAKNGNFGIGYGFVIDSTSVAVEGNTIIVQEVNSYGTGGKTISGQSINGADIKVMFVHTCGIAWEDSASFTDNRVAVFDYGETAGTGLIIRGDSNQYDYILRVNNIRTTAVNVQASAFDNQITLNTIARNRGIVYGATLGRNNILPMNESARVWRDSAQSIPDATATAISFSDEISDSGNMWVVGSPTRLTVAIPGLYLVTAQGSFSGSTGGTAREIMIMKNGSDIISDALNTHYGENSTNINTTAIAYLAIGDYVEMKVFQNSGGNLDFRSETGGSISGRSPVFMISRIG